LVPMTMAVILMVAVWELISHPKFDLVKAVLFSASQISPRQGADEGRLGA